MSYPAAHLDNTLSPADTRPVPLDSVLYVRVESDLLLGLDSIVTKKNEENPGTRITRSDVARMLLLKEIARSKRKNG